MCKVSELPIGVYKHMDVRFNGNPEPTRVHDLKIVTEGGRKYGLGFKQDRNAPKRERVSIAGSTEVVTKKPHKKKL